MLEEVLGPDKAIVRIACTLDFKKHEKTEEKYYPDNQVVRSEQSFNESSNSTENLPVGIPGMKSNINADKTNTSTDSGSTSFQKQDRTLNYEIGKVTSHTIEPVGVINKLSIAIIIDGTYKKEIMENDAGEEEQHISIFREPKRKWKNLEMSLSGRLISTRPVAIKLKLQTYLLKQINLNWN